MHRRSNYINELIFFKIILMLLCKITFNYAKENKTEGNACFCFYYIYYVLCNSIYISTGIFFTDSSSVDLTNSSSSVLVTNVVNKEVFTITLQFVIKSSIDDGTNLLLIHNSSKTLLSISVNKDCITYQYKRKIYTLPVVLLQDKQVSLHIEHNEHDVAVYYNCMEIFEGTMEVTDDNADGFIKEKQSLFLQNNVNIYLFFGPNY